MMLLAQAAPVARENQSVKCANIAEGLISCSVVLWLTQTFVSEVTMKK